MQILDLIMNEYKLRTFPLLNIDRICPEDSDLYIQRNRNEWDFRNWVDKSEFRGNSNKMIVGPAGVGKTTFVDYFFSVNNRCSNYIYIDMRMFFSNGIDFEINEFYHHLFDELNDNLTKHHKDLYPISEVEVASDPRYWLQRLLDSRFKDKNLPSLYIFIDNIDVRPKEMHTKSLHALTPILTRKNPRVIFSSRRSFAEYVRGSITSDFFTSFDSMIQLSALPLWKVLHRRLLQVSPLNELECPFTQDAINFIEKFSNSNLQTSLWAYAVPC